MASYWGIAYPASLDLACWDLERECLGLDEPAVASSPEGPGE